MDVAIVGDDEVVVVAGREEHGLDAAQRAFHWPGEDRAFLSLVGVAAQAAAGTPPPGEHAAVAAKGGDMERACRDRQRLPLRCLEVFDPLRDAQAVLVSMPKLASLAAANGVNGPVPQEEEKNITLGKNRQGY